MLGPINDWETRWYGFEMRSGVGDLINNNMKWIIENIEEIRKDPELLEWAEACVWNSFDLLMWRARWPWYMNDWIPAWRVCKTRLCSLLNKWKFLFAKKVGWKTTVKYRSQGDMTVDLYIAAITCAMELGYPVLIQNVKLPWYLYIKVRTVIWIWYMKTGKGLYIYNKLNPKKLHKDNFVNDLRKLRRLAIELKQNTL